MPELPDVERYRRILEADGLGRPIAGMRVSDRRILDGITPKALAARLAGATLVAARRHGKHLLARLDRGGWLALHFGMSGSLAPFADADDAPRFTRLCLDFRNGEHLAYISWRMLGRIGLAGDDEAFIRERALGPDALDPALDERALARLLCGARRGVKAALMDQGLIAGIGNVYSDEILFQARLHPTARLDSLDAAACARLARQTRRVLETAVARGAGSEDFLDRLPRGYLLPHRVKGGACPRCGSRLETVKSGGRSGYFCPVCQPTP